MSDPGPDKVAIGVQAPPVAEVEPTVRELHGVRRVDDYAWLRDKASARTSRYLDAERAFYDAATAHLGPLRQRLFSEMSGRTLPADRSVSWVRGGHVYLTQTVEGREYAQLLRTSAEKSSAEDAYDVILDENVLAEGHDYCSVGLCEPSPDGRVLAYAVDVEGDEIYTLVFRDLDTGEDLPDQIDRVHYLGGAWSADSEWFFYTVPDAAWRSHRVLRHRLGTPAADDVVVFEDSDEKYEVSVEASLSGDYVIIHTANRDTSEAWLVPATDPQSEPTLVQGRRPGIEYYVSHAPRPDGDVLLIVTNDEAREFRLMRTPVTKPAREHWEELVGEDSAERLESVEVFAQHVVMSLRRDGNPLLRIVRRDGSEEAIDVHAGLEAAQIRLARNEVYDTGTVSIRVESYTAPPAWFDLDLATGKRTLVKQTAVPSYAADDYISERYAVEATDGALIPVSVARRLDTPLDGSAPCYLYAYGSYESVDWPEWLPELPSMLDRGVVFAHAHIRGGGELGRNWWDEGHLSSKQNTFSDLIAVADGLADGMVDGDRIVTRGLSAGGLLQGAVFSQRPDRWRGVVAEVPFVDVVTTMLDASIPLTAGEWDEWGDPRRPEDFAWMLAYSPYDNLPPAGVRPDLLVTGAVHDTRVMVWEPAKWTAALRASDPDWSPRCLFRVETGAGSHGGPSGRYARLHYEAEVYAWILERFGLE